MIHGHNIFAFRRRESFGEFGSSYDGHDEPGPGVAGVTASLVRTQSQSRPLDEHPVSLMADQKSIRVMSVLSDMADVRTKNLTAVNRSQVPLNQRFDAGTESPN